MGILDDVLNGSLLENEASEDYGHRRLCMLN